MALEKWALPQLSRLLPLDEGSLKQIIQYSETLSPDAAAQHLKELIGDSSQALEFITSFNSRRRSSSVIKNENSDRHASSEVPKSRPRKKNPINTNKLPPVRLPENHGNSTGGYLKKEQEDYMPAKHGSVDIYEDSAESSNTEISNNKKADKSQISSRKATKAPLKLPPSASGPLISDVAPSRLSSSSSSSFPIPKPESSLSLSSNKSKVKVKIHGGTPMHGKSTLLNDLDSAIRSLEIQTNPTLANGKNGKATKQQQEDKDKSRRRCDCMASRHPLLTAAPNCLNCGKIICVNEGLGPCTFCDQLLLSSNDLHSMLRVLREERGRERTNVHNASQKRADHVASSAASARKQLAGARSLHPTPPLSSAPSSDAELGFDNEDDGKINDNANANADENSVKLTAARHHRDKLLAFQAQNSQRTRVHDEAAEYDTPIAGLSMWASPQERALQLKQQQRVLREQEWNARPEYEKRRMVVSVDLVGGGKVVKRMAEVDRPASPSREEAEREEADDDDDHQDEGTERTGGKSGGAFSRNPLLGSLIKPVIDSKGKSAPRQRNSAASSTWRRVQDDNDDNEQLMLEGRLYGGETVDSGAYRQKETVY